MNQKQKSKKSQILFIFSIFFVVVLLFTLLVPKVSSQIFPQKNELNLNHFISEIQKDKKINPQAYWEFREFYSPGFFDFSKNGLDKNNTRKALGKIEISPIGIDYYFLKFNSAKTVSLDGFTKKTKFSDLIDKKTMQINEIFLENDNSIVYKDNENQTFVIFLLPSTEMLTANGFYDVNSKKDADLMRGEYWFNVTKIN